MTENLSGPYGPENRPRGFTKMHGVALFIVLALIAACCLSMIATFGSSDITPINDEPVIEQTFAPGPTGSPKTKPAAAATTIRGDDVVHVGEDVPAGTYRVVTAIDDNGCYWAKTSDAEGSKIIDNGIPSGGRPQVTLKTGQWFTSNGCPDWRKK